MVIGRRGALVAATIFAVSTAALAITSLALAGTEPRKDIRPAQQALATSIALKRGDLPGTGWKAEKTSSDDTSPRCSYYNPDQSDLTEYGDAESAFSLGAAMFVASDAAVFATPAQGRTAYRRVVQPALARCLAEIFQKSVKPNKATVLSTGRLAFPRLSERTDAYRISVQVGAIPATLDIVLLNQGRVDVAVMFVSVGTPATAVFERSVVRTIAARLP